MIAVIADDLTGAAEIAGLGLRYGLTVEVVTTADQLPAADLVVIATDARSMPKQQALQIMAEITIRLSELKPDLIYKKVDSVLRGHIIAELNVHLKHLHINSALLIPANPSLGRTLTNNNYFINGEPIHLSSFAHDPDFAITDADVYRMLRVNKQEVVVQSCVKPLPPSGIVIGECVTDDDLKKWAEKAGKARLLAGGAGFFNAILASLNLHPVPQKKDVHFKQPALFVCGSTFNKSKKLVEEVKIANGPVSYMPLDIIITSNPSDLLFEQWADEIISFLNLHKKAIIAVNENSALNIELINGNLREKKARVIEKILQRISLKELLIEGGATAAAIIKQLNLNQFFPVQEFSAGVIRMKADKKEELFLTFKPGSYDWPRNVWNF